MAHIAFHFSVGLATGTVCLLPWLMIMFPANERKANLTGKWIIICYSLGLWAVIPNILRRLGIPENICSGWWMNIFFLHHLINEIKKGGMLIGEITITACFFLQYIVLLITLKTVMKKRRRQGPAALQ